MHLLFNSKNFILINIVIAGAWLLLFLVIVSMSESRMLLPASVTNFLVADCAPSESMWYAAVITQPCLLTLSILIAALQVILLIYTMLYFFVQSASHDLTAIKFKTIYAILVVLTTFFALLLPLLFNGI